MTRDRNMIRLLLLQVSMGSSADIKKIFKIVNSRGERPYDLVKKKEQ